jgi:hypothetical protein
MLKKWASMSCVLRAFILQRNYSAGYFHRKVSVKGGNS